MMKASFNIGLQPRVLRMLPEPTTGTAVIGRIGLGAIGPIEPVAAIIGSHAPGGAELSELVGRIEVVGRIGVIELVGRTRLGGLIGAIGLGLI
jgi:hypothetical protein